MNGPKDMQIYQKALTKNPCVIKKIITILLTGLLLLFLGCNLEPQEESINQLEIIGKWNCQWGNAGDVTVFDIRSDIFPVFGVDSKIAEYDNEKNILFYQNPSDAINKPLYYFRIVWTESIASEEGKIGICFDDFTGDETLYGARELPQYADGTTADLSEGCGSLGVAWNYCAKVE